MDFKNAKELLALCQKKKLPISEVMRQREILLGETTAEIVDQRMDRVLEIMKDAAFSPIKDPVISMGGLIGGEARKLCEFHDLGKSLCGNVLGKGITYAMATLETNASMGLIVASPTAGSAGIVPGMMLALQEVYGFSDKKIRQALFNAGAIGYLAMRNATVAGAVGGCQAEVGIASAMAASCVPSLAAAYAKKDAKLVRSRINSSIRFIMVIAFPCAVGIGVLASPIMQLLFGDGGKEIELMLRIGAVSIVFYSLSTLTNALLQGVNRMQAPVKNALIALVLHIIVLLVCMYGLNLGIYSVVIANAFFALFMCTLNRRSLKRYTRYRQEVGKTFIVPAISSAIMGVAVFFAYDALHKLIHSNAISTVVCIALGGVVYIVCLFLFKGLSEEELINFPKGATLVRIFKKLHLLR